MAPILPAVVIQYVKHENLLLEGRHSRQVQYLKKGILVGWIGPNRQNKAILSDEVVSLCQHYSYGLLSAIKGLKPCP